MKYEYPNWDNLSPHRKFQIQARHYFSHRTDPKPRPERYREMGWGRYERKSAWVKNPLMSPVESLEASQTGEGPPVPSKGQDEARRGVERATPGSSWIAPELRGPYEDRRMWDDYRL